ncbi:MAG: ABC transporter permease, partial [Candidatus Binatia bacterium]
MRFSRSLWVWKMAWRDGRRGRKKLLMAALPVVLGVASLVGISSYGKSLEIAIQQQSKALLGADLSIESRQPFSRDAQTLIAGLGGEQSQQTGFSSMIRFPKNGATQLAQIRALEGNFPYYGVLETDPLTAAQTFQQGPYALVDEGLLVQHDIQVGDSISIGNSSFRITGKLKRIPGETLAAALISPRVYIPMRYLDRT